MKKVSEGYSVDAVRMVGDVKRARPLHVSRHTTRPSVEGGVIEMLLTPLLPYS